MIEHLERAVGEELLRFMTVKARRPAVSFTRSGRRYPTDPARHRPGSWARTAASGWEPT